jgi:hypothetical protein
VEGFLKGSGLLLIHNEELWDLVDVWVSGLHEDIFVQVLPLLKRTFSTFTRPERRQMGERVTRGTRAGGGRRGGEQTGIDIARADKVLPVLSMILGVSQPAQETKQ